MRDQKDIVADVVGNLRQLTDTMQEFAESLQGTDTPPAVGKEVVITPTLEEVRAVLAKLSVAGHSAAVKSLIAKFGANKLSDIAPKQYAALLKEAERIGT